MANRTDVSTIDWSKFKYMVYDMPKHPGTYKERYEALGTQRDTPALPRPPS